MLRHPEQAPDLTDTSWPTPPHIPALDRDAIHVWKCDVSAVAEYEPMLRRSLHGIELARGSRFHHAADRTRFQLSRGLLRALSSHYLGRPAAALAIDAGEFGKPHLAGADQGLLAFNISHSGDLLLLAFARSGRLGVDVERWSLTLRDSERQRIANSVFSVGEQAAIAQLPAEARQAAFYCVWTRKEAYIKATGLGLSRGLDHFEVSALAGEPSIKWDSILRESVADWRCFDLLAGPGYSAALVTDVTAARIVTMSVDSRICRGFVPLEHERFLSPRS